MTDEHTRNVIKAIENHTLTARTAAVDLAG